MLTILCGTFLRYKDKIDSLDYVVLVTIGAAIELVFEFMALLAILG